MNRIGKRGGFSLAELMISLTILSVVMGALVSAVVRVQRGYVDQRERVRAQESLRVAQMTLITILRAAGANPFNLTSVQLDPDPDNNRVFDDIRVVSDFNPPDGDVADALEDVRAWVSNDTLWVRWQAGATPQALAEPIRSLRFRYYANNGTELTGKAQVVGATRAMFVLEAPRDPRLGTLERIESWWVQLRNRTSN
jgi:prepilin-type N-terminal cleavage/methylation domain-containing protein